MIDLTRIESCTAYAMILLLVFLLWHYFGSDLRSGIGFSNTYTLPLPPGPKGLPLLGNIFQMDNNAPWLQYLSWSRKYGELVYVNIAGRKLLFINSYKAAHNLLNLQADFSSDRPDMPMMYLLGWDYVLGVMRYGETWKAYNHLFNQHFQPKSIHKYYPASARSAHLLLKEILVDPKGFRQSIRNATGAFIMSITYGHDVSLFSTDEYISIAEAALETFNAAGNPGAFYVDLFPSLMYIPEWLMPSWAFKKKASLWRPIIKLLKEKPYEMVCHRMRNGTAKSCIATNTILDELGPALVDDLELKERENIVQGFIATVCAAGIDTTESTITTLFMLMVLYPEVQKKAQQELDSVLAEGAMPNISDRSQLPYIEALCMELLRWHPVAPQSIAHCADRDMTYDGYLIPKGTLLIGNLWTILHDEDIYPDRPLEFFPERFLDCQSKINRSVFHPSKAVFGFGRRMCPGRHAADAHIFLTVASILRVCRLTHAVDDAGTPVTLSPSFTNEIVSHPKKFQCDVQPRSEAHKTMIDALELGDGYILE